MEVSHQKNDGILLYFIRHQEAAYRTVHPLKTETHKHRHKRTVKLILNENLWKTIYKAKDQRRMY